MPSELNQSKNEGRSRLIYHRIELLVASTRVESSGQSTDPIIARHTLRELTHLLACSYSLGVAYGSVFDNPDLLSVVVVGDGESETGPTAAAWQ